jgi:hypothetical protein
VLTSLWSSVGGKLADRFLDVSAPALVFWVAGLAAWCLGHGGLHALSALPASFDKKPALVQAVLLAALLTAIAASGLVVERFTLPVLRLLEGYWPGWGWVSQLRSRLIARGQRKAAVELEAWQSLMRQPDLTPDQRARMARLDEARYRRPADPAQFMPTPIGNILRASELRPFSKYGLDPVRTWPGIWQVLPGGVQGDVSAARKALDGSVAAIVWGVLFLVFIPWTILALPAGLVLAALALFLWVPARAKDYGDMVEAVYDMHRAALYGQLRWPLPVNPQDEQAQGKLITEYLSVGLDGATPRFSPPARGRQSGLRGRIRRPR